MQDFRASTAPATKLSSASTLSFSPPEIAGSVGEGGRQGGSEGGREGGWEGGWEGGRGEGGGPRER